MDSSSIKFANIPRNKTHFRTFLRAAVKKCAVSIWSDPKTDQGHRKVWLIARYTGYTRRRSADKRRRNECFT